jgi:hypothetical protein
MEVDPSIAVEAEAAARRSEEAAEAFFRAAPPLRDRDRVAASVADFVARHSAGKWPPRSLTSPLALIPPVRLLPPRPGSGWLLQTIQISNELLLTLIACCRERRCGRARRGDLHHLRRHHGAPGAALRALHRQLRLRPAGGGRHRVHTHTAPSCFCLSPLRLLFRTVCGKMQVFCQRRLCCHLHPSPVSTSNQPVFVAVFPTCSIISLKLASVCLIV